MGVFEHEMIFFLFPAKYKFMHRLTNALDNLSLTASRVCPIGLSERNRVQRHDHSYLNGMVAPTAGQLRALVMLQDIGIHGRLMSP